MKTGPKECVDCRAETCDPCPAMAGEDGAVLALLERLAINGAVGYARCPEGNWDVMVTSANRTCLHSKAATLYQALLLAEEALRENEAQEVADGA